MELENEEFLNKIPNCPLKNEKGELKLYRCVQHPFGAESFEPYAASKEKLRNSCLAWGLSTYKNLNSARETLNNLSQKKQNIYNAIAEYTVSEMDGVKHQSLNNRHHYTFYPVKGFDFVRKFKLIQND